MRIILIGGGRLTYFLAKQFAMAKHSLTIINRDEAEARLYARTLHTTVVLGDGSDPTILAEANVPQSDVLLALTAHDQDNLVACQIAQKRCGIPRTIAMVNDPDYQTVFEKLGITVAFSATQILAALIEQQADFFDIQSLFPVNGGKVTVTEIVLDADSPAISKTIQTLFLPSGSLIGCIIRNDKIIVPQGSSCLCTGDRLILIAQPEQTDTLLAAFIN